MRTELSTRRASSILAAMLILCAVAGASCSRTGGRPAEKLSYDIDGLYLGETKAEVEKSARGIAELTPAPEVPYGFRGDLYNLSAPLEGQLGVDHIRLAFFDDQLWEIIVYYKDTGVDHLNYLKAQIEGTYGVPAKAPESTIEQAFKTYRLDAPGMSVTLRRITKKDETELYVQYIHKVLQQAIVEKGALKKQPARG
jgi:hypothetical protein